MTEDHNYAERQKNEAFKKWFRSYIKSSWWRIAILVVVSLSAVVLTLINPWPLKILADSVFNKIPAPGLLKPYTHTLTLLYIVALIYVAIYVLQSLVAILSGYLGARFGFKLDMQVKGSVFRHILYLPYKSEDRLESADYVYRENVEAGSLSQIVLGSYISIFGSAVTVIGIFVVLFLLYWQLAALMLIAFPLLYFSIKIFSRRIQNQSKLLEENNSELYVHTQDSIENDDIVQAFNRQETQFKGLIELLSKRLKTQLSYNLTLGGFGLVNSMISVSVIVAIAIVGGTAVFDGKLSFGSLLIFINYASFLYLPLETISTSIASINQNLAGLRRVFDVVNDHADLENTKAGQQIDRVNGQITFKNVSCSYGGKQILKDVNFTIMPKEKVAFIGPSGAGKSTLLSLILRFTIPDSGFIYMDNYEIHDINLDSLRKNIAVVDQEPKLFSMSVADNIAFDSRDEKFPLIEVMAAAQAANATDFINELPNKFDQKIEHTGHSLSGGQKQRIAIARALYKKAPILLLDEPTSAQDVSSERHVLDAINKLIQNRTVLMVSHKLSLLSQMDRVFVVEAGKVQDVKNYGGLDAYKRYMEVHETE